VRLIGALLIVIGIVGLAYGGITWTKHDTVVQVGPVQVTHDKTKSLPLPPVAGGVCLVAGVVLVAMAGGAKRIV
jgi:hypothetical protein